MHTAAFFFVLLLLCSVAFLVSREPAFFRFHITLQSCIAHPSPQKTDTITHIPYTRSQLRAPVPRSKSTGLFWRELSKWVPCFWGHLPSLLCCLSLPLPQLQDQKPGIPPPARRGFACQQTRAVATGLGPRIALAATKPPPHRILEAAAAKLPRRELCGLPDRRRHFSQCAGAGRNFDLRQRAHRFCLD